jgi:hypothetical protein
LSKTYLPKIEYFPLLLPLKLGFLESIVKSMVKMVQWNLTHRFLMSGNGKNGTIESSSDHIIREL